MESEIVKEENAADRNSEFNEEELTNEIVIDLGIENKLPAQYQRSTIVTKDFNLEKKETVSNDIPKETQVDKIDLEKISIDNQEKNIPVPTINDAEENEQVKHMQLTINDAHKSNEDLEKSNLNSKTSNNTNNQNEIMNENNINILRDHNLMTRHSLSQVESQEKKEKRVTIFKKTDVTQGSSYDFIFKIALIGDSGIGKTSILIRFVDEMFRNDTTSTIGVDFKLVSFRIESKLAKMQIWDTCGSERFKALTSSFIKSCSVFVLVFDLTKQKSFINLDNWLKLIKENVNPKLLCLVGNKADLPDQRQVTLEDAIKFANKHDLKYLETSAKSNFGIENLFSYIAEKLYDDTIKMRIAETDKKNKKLSQRNNNKAFELGPSSNINKENEKKKANEDSDDSDGENPDSPRKITKSSKSSHRKNCNC